MISRKMKYIEGKSFFLFGPRGTGKTTWVKDTFKEAIYIDLLKSETFNDLLPNPQKIERFIPQNFKNWIIIDEVQRVPEILNEVHRLIEDKKYKFILTGSSPRKLKKKSPNLLAGRALTKSFFPLTAIEIGDKYDLMRSLKYGQLPSVYVEANPKEYLSLIHISL